MREFFCTFTAIMSNQNTYLASKPRYENYSLIKKWRWLKKFPATPYFFIILWSNSNIDEI